MEVLLANPRGFCAGVERAIEIVERALELFGAPIYVRHEIVHNKFVVDRLRAKGAVFVEELAEVPAGGTVIFSAHGVSKAVQAEADRRGLKVFDATCPLVSKVHIEVKKMLREGHEIVMIGHRGHPEAEGTMGQSAVGMHLVETLEDVAALDVGPAAKKAAASRLKSYDPINLQHSESGRSAHSLIPDCVGSRNGGDDPVASSQRCGRPPRKSGNRRAAWRLDSTKPG